MDRDENNLSDYKRDLLKKFRLNLEDLLTPDQTDFELLKWLRTKNFDLKKAEQNFREVNACRKIYGIDTITDTYVKPEVVQKYERSCRLGFAKDGSAVRYYALHNNLNGFAHSMSAFDICLYFCNNVQGDIKATREHNKKTGQNSSEITFVVDGEGFSFQDVYYKSVIEISLNVIALFQDHYPEIWARFLFVNAPYYADKFVMLFKPVVKSALWDRLYIAPRSSTSQLLRKYIDDEVIPAFLGGSRVGSKGDPYCREIVNGYFIIPEKYYLKNTMHVIDETDSDVKVATIRARSMYNAPLIVKKTGTKIRVEMRTENGGIYFSLLYRDITSDSENPELPECDEYFYPDVENSNVRVVGSRLRVEGHIAPCDGTFTAPWPGLYIFLFDNTSSWVGSRKLFYRITASQPDL